MCIQEDTAIVWDMGDSVNFNLWNSEYTKTGSPFIKAIILSHGDMDHKGGLSYLQADKAFSGLVIVNPYQDTASLRSFSSNWKSSIRFKSVKQGDTLLLLNNLFIECLWPPFNPVDSVWINNQYTENRFSLCFKVTFKNTSFLITSDIDTIAEEMIYRKYGFSLNSDIVVVPHHGSRYSLDIQFYGYSAPKAAIISCGVNNSYNHPSDVVIQFFALQMQIPFYDTRYDGTVTFYSNGLYWQ